MKYKILNYFYKKISDILFLFKITLQLMEHSKKNLLRIEEIDLKKNKAVIYCHGTRTLMYVKLHNMISDKNLLLNTPPYQAALVGYYYGKLNSPKKNSMNFLIYHVKGRYKIISLDRAGFLTYMDTNNNKHFTEAPLKILQQEIVISQFDPSQACYIGILAGSASDKKNIKFQNSRIVLKLV